MGFLFLWLLLLLCNLVIGKGDYVLRRDRLLPEAFDCFLHCFNVGARFYMCDCCLTLKLDIECVRSFPPCSLTWCFFLLPHLTIGDFFFFETKPLGTLSQTQGRKSMSKLAERARPGCCWWTMQMYILLACYIVQGALTLQLVTTWWTWLVCTDHTWYPTLLF